MLAPEALQRRRRDDGLAGAADADRQVVVRAADGRADGGGHVAVLDQLDARAGGADLLDQILVAWAVEHDRGDVVGLAAERVGDRADVLAHGLPEIDLAARDRPDGHLPHVHLREPWEAARLADGDHGHRPVVAPGDDAPPLERVDGQIDLRPAGADLRPDLERIVVLVAADDDAAR